MTDLWLLRGRAGAAALIVTLAARAPALAAPAPASRAPAPAAPAPAPAVSAPAWAAPLDRPAPASPLRTAVVVPTAVRPQTADRWALALAGELDALLSDTAHDLGLSVAPAGAAGLAEGDLAARAHALGSLVIAPSLELDREEVELRLVLAAPTSPTLRVRVERVARDEVATHAAVMLRDLLADLDGHAKRGGQLAPAPLCAECGGRQTTPLRSAGRATLVANSMVFGGLVGYSIQRSSGSEDPRLLYPLLAVGVGIGFGGASIIAEEWDVGVTDAWFLSSGAWWPTIAGHLLYAGRFAPYAKDPDQERWAFGLIGGTTGIALAGLGLSLRGISDGGALMAHSGGGLGLVLGGLAELSVNGDINSTPLAGMGYGAALGWLVAAAAATQTDISTTRVVAIDVGALLGGLGGAALGSPLVFQSPTKDQQRVWVGAAAGGFLVGAGVAWFVTRAPAATSRLASEAKGSSMGVGLPMIGVVGESVIGSRRAPVLGLGWQGSIP